MKIDIKLNTSSQYFKIFYIGLYHFQIFLRINKMYNQGTLDGGQASLQAQNGGQTAKSLLNLKPVAEPESPQRYADGAKGRVGKRMPKTTKAGSMSGVAISVQKQDMASVNTLENNFVTGPTSTIRSNNRTYTQTNRSNQPDREPHESGTAQLNNRLNQYSKNLNSIKQRMHLQSRQQNSSNILSNDAATAASQGHHILSKNELKAVKYMSKNREIYQMLGRTQTNNMAYLTGGLGGWGGGRSIASQRSLSGRIRQGSGASSRSKRSSKSKSSAGNLRINETIRSAQSRKGRQSQANSIKHSKELNSRRLSKQQFRNENDSQIQLSQKQAQLVDVYANNLQDSPQTSPIRDTYNENQHQIEAQHDQPDQQANFQPPLQSILKSSISTQNYQNQPNMKSEGSDLTKNENKLFKIRSTRKMVGSKDGAWQMRQSVPDNAFKNKILSPSMQQNQEQQHYTDRGVENQVQDAQKVSSENINSFGNGSNPQLNQKQESGYQMEQIIGPGSIVSPQNREALQQAKQSMDLRSKGQVSTAAEQRSYHRKSQSSAVSLYDQRKHQAESHDQQANEILQKYPGLVGNLYSQNPQQDGKQSAQGYPRNLLRINTESEFSSQKLKHAVESYQEGMAIQGSQNQPLDQATGAASSEGASPYKDMQSGLSHAGQMILEEQQHQQNIQQLQQESEQLLKKSKSQQKTLSKKQASSREGLKYSSSRQADRMMQIKKNSEDAFMKFAAHQNKTAKSSSKQFANISKMLPNVLFSQQNQQRRVAPSQKIESLKKQTKNLVDDNQKYRDMIEGLDLKNTKTGKNLVELKKKAIQANSDRVELMRDLATYECNYSDQSKLRDWFFEIIQQVSKAKMELGMNVKFSEEGQPYFTHDSYSTIEYDCNDSPGLDSNNSNKKDMLKEVQNEVEKEFEVEEKGQKGMLKDSQINQVLSNLMMLQSVRRNRFQSTKTQQLPENQLTEGSLEEQNAKQYLVQKLSQSPKANHFTTRESRDKSAQSDYKSKQNTRQRIKETDVALMRINNTDDDIYQQMMISGLTCIIQAKNVNGGIKVNLTCQSSTRSFKVEIPPTQSKKTNVFARSEVQRLFFESRKNKIGKERLQLDTRDPSEDVDTFSSFLVPVKGGFHRYVNMQVEMPDEQKRKFKVLIDINKGKDKNQDQEVLTWITEPDINQFFKINPINMRGLELSTLSWLVAKYVQYKMVVVQKTNTGGYVLVDETEAQS